jgi:hypothetical protein
MTLAGGLPSVEKPVTCRGSSRLGAADESWEELGFDLQNSSKIQRETENT